MTRKLFLFCLLPVLCAVPAGDAWGSGRQEALIGLSPSFERVGGDSTYARLKVTYDGTPVTQGLRGYHVVLDFNDTYVFMDDAELDVLEGDLLPAEGTTAFFRTMEDGNTLVVDGSILGETDGATGPGELFEVRFSARPTGDGTSPVEFVEVVLRDPDNAPIAFSTADGAIELDNTPPDVPTMAPLPVYSPGTTKTVYWSDESASGAVGYCGEAADNPGFDPIHMTSGCTPNTQATFVNLDDGQIYYYRVMTRDDLWNTSDWSATVSSTQDNTPPSTSAGPIDPYYDTMAFFIPVNATDATSGTMFVRLFYRVDGGPYQQFDGTFFPQPIYFQADTEGEYDFYTIGTDRVNNVEDPPSVPDCSTIVDWTEPPPPTDLVALPGHNRIHLSWTVPEERGSPIEGTLLVRKEWGAGAYPEYDDSMPPAGYPAGPGDGVMAAFVPGTGDQTYDDTGFTDSTRSVYYYTAFTRDGAGNYSAASVSAQDRATSYWLADVDDETGAAGVYDGFVDYWDKIILSFCYNTQDGDPHYEPEMDVGPTDDSSRFGVPLTDDWIDFEDLMIVAMNYGRVDPSSRLAAAGRQVLAGPRGRLEVRLDSDSETPAEGDVLDVTLGLAGDGFPVRGLSCALDYDPCVLEFVRARPDSALSAAGDESFFYSSAGPTGTARIDLAMLGPERAVAAAGPVATVRFRAVSSRPTTLSFAECVARSDRNEEIDCLASGLELNGATEKPHALRLLQNVPNPFNPVTRIGFSLDRETEARIAIYSAGGRLVRTLVDERLPAGEHRVRWNGTTDGGTLAPSGIYFCVLEAGEARLTRKLVLAK
ncbi:MAG: hypothetical protein GF400_06720 [Candidatus Eisenbacteria bacterium]|nr:hypothetical protein [Candidatus Eisenbacteria bacterium]